MNQGFSGRYSKLDIGLLFCLLSLTVFVCASWATANYSPNVVETIVSLTYVVVFSRVVKKKGFLSLQGLFLFAVGFFGLFGVILTVVGLADYTHYISSFVNYYWPENTRLTVLSYYQLLIVTSFFVFAVLPVWEDPSSREKNPIPERESFVLIGKTLIAVCFPFAVINCLVELSLVMSSGYASYYSGGARSSVTAALSFFVLMFEIGFFVMCAGRPKERIFNRYGAMFLVYALLDSLKGARGLFVIPLLFFLFYRYQVYGKRISKAQIIAILIGGLSLLFVYTAIREGSVNSLQGGLLSIVLNQIAQASGSISIAALYNDFGQSMNNYGYPYIFEPIVRLYDVLVNPSIYASGQSLPMIEVRNSLSHQLSFTLNQNRYLAGANLGSSMIAEMSQFGHMGVVVFSFIFCLFVKYVDEKWSGSFMMGFLLYPLFSQIVFAPRGAYFFDTYTLAKYLIVFLVVLVASGWVSSRKKSEEQTIPSYVSI